jgi:CubicO group peptidase (beta-lactamase class C family)
MLLKNEKYSDSTFLKEFSKEFGAKESPPDHYKDITIKHLLQHTAAIGNNPASDTFRKEVSEDTTRIWTYGEFLNNNLCKRR